MNTIVILVLIAGLLMVLLGFLVSACIQAIRDLQAEVDLLEDEFTRLSTKVHILEDKLDSKSNILKG